jgi:hypothetical protein
MGLGSLIVLLNFCLIDTVCGPFSYPSSASVRVYLGQLVDGPTADQNWKTTVILTNPNTTDAAQVRLSFYNNAGNPLALDFGQGAAATLNATVPAGGTKVLTTLGTSPTGLVGWGIMEAIDAPPSAPATPVSASLLYRASLSGGRWWDVATAGTGATFFYSSYATRDLGVAVANPSATTAINLEVKARNEDGTSPGGPWTVNLPPLGHLSWNLNSAPTNLTSFTGSIEIKSADTVPQGFVALSLNYRDPVISPLPPGDTHYPAPYDRRPADLSIRARQAAKLMVQLGAVYVFAAKLPSDVLTYLDTIGLVVDNSATLSASYLAADNKVHISTGLVEALGANDAALAFVIAHMTAHGVVHYAGMPDDPVFAGKPELLADSAAADTLIVGGSDPSGAADFFGRLLYADTQGLPIDNALRTEFSLASAAAVSTRIASFWSVVRTGCAAFPLESACQKTRVYWHPSNPTAVP